MTRNSGQCLYLPKYLVSFKTCIIGHMPYKCHIGVGTKTANMWYDSGYRTLKEVLEKAKLVKAVRLGIQLLPHFDQP